MLIFGLVATWSIIVFPPNNTAFADRVERPHDLSLVRSEGSGTIFAAGDIAQCEPTSEIYHFVRYVPWEIGGNTQYYHAPKGAMQSANLIKGQHGIVLGLGDLAYKSGAMNEYRHCYDRAWGAFKDRTFPTPGNHEYKWGGLGYYGYWGARAGQDRKGYYSFDYYGWHIISLNSEIYAGPGSGQARWLAADLARSKAECVLAFFHRPAFSSQNRKGAENARYLFRLLYKNYATLVLSGHNHFYERLAPLNPAGHVEPNRGLRQFVVGSGGAKLTSVRHPKDFSQAHVNGRWGVLKLELEPGRYSWSFLAADNGEVLDRGSDTCVAGRSVAINHLSHPQ